MKRAYSKPVAKFIAYSYDEQVVAESSKFDGYGDGHKINHCTYESGLFTAPCSAIVYSEFGTDICNFMPRSIL